MSASSRALVESAVLVPVYRDTGGRLVLILIRRSAHGIHGGQIAFPGGKRDAHDASLRDTALREANEEIGLDPAHVEFLDDLPIVDTQSTGFRIAPFLARVRPERRWRLHQIEVEEVLEVPVDDLLRPEAHGERDWHFEGRPGPVRLPFYRVGPYELWGATYRIVKPLLPRLQAGEYSR
jgi:8-oxo-dGTP pyrophosphatase MutT (NUDIX family)